MHLCQQFDISPDFLGLELKLIEHGFGFSIRIRIPIENEMEVE